LLIFRYFDFLIPRHAVISDCQKVSRHRDAHCYYVVIITKLSTCHPTGRTQFSW